MIRDRIIIIFGWTHTCTYGICCWNVFQVRRHLQPCNDLRRSGDVLSGKNVRMRTSVIRIDCFRSKDFLTLYLLCLCVLLDLFLLCVTQFIWKWCELIEQFWIYFVVKILIRLHLIDWLHLTRAQTEWTRWSRVLKSGHKHKTQKEEILDSNFCDCHVYSRPFLPVRHRSKFDKLLNYDPLRAVSSSGSHSDHVRSLPSSGGGDVLRSLSSGVTSPSNFNSSGTLESYNGSSASVR